MGFIPEEFRLDYYDYPLPEELIAYFPSEDRKSSRLLVIDRKNQKFFFHQTFAEIEKYFKKGDLLILNNTKVFPARLKGIKPTGGEAEVLLFEKPQGLSFQTLALIKGKRIRKGTQITAQEIIIKVIEPLEGGRFLVELKADKPLETLIYKYGKAPLPPYIKRDPTDLDLLRYQTVYAQKEGAIAAPTAGFHFDTILLNQLKEKGVKINFITLHVGYGTFAPIKVQDIRKHQVAPEYIEVEEEVVEEIKKSLKEKRRIFAVGTTTVRTLEFIAQKGLISYKGLCDLYICPGFTFQVVSAMITNFHLPKSSLLLLVCAFAGRDLIFKAYQEAISRKYRFYSYGDATLIL
ncbi:tRNA preQ1(34) S-adenosylmethionine ribosyltransferase-isomerase QueA [Thermodesulfobacterium sp. TA1]|uniref:tRNA preQ1(34) S-adenosylmethionine ribosyltransferase-isomerase QueA n=1 Tax=Thermodesulfobacterium sp. TA1 TaxID=2234087 RepID=UPI00123204C8|nr:tRNA preQ1(34) S-adenosylmethionine ribosyltransferase-isomerase QueA [Thermodesulfobacterium sp. TA1]QER42389.1 tRNA preQ1(34) S-adenosylmethionine ribosyltransferase-isomerase QueA [Thermodesulfobacterium sp. TA1]